MLQHLSCDLRQNYMFFVVVFKWVYFEIQQPYGQWQEPKDSNINCFKTSLQWEAPYSTIMATCTVSFIFGWVNRGQHMLKITPILYNRASMMHWDILGSRVLRIFIVYDLKVACFCLAVTWFMCGLGFFKVYWLIRIHRESLFHVDRLSNNYCPKIQ